MEIITDASTCPNCGNYLPMSPMQAAKKKKGGKPSAKIGFAIGAVAVAAAVGGGFFVTNSLAGGRYAKQLELGRQYYEAGDYDAAQVAYNKAFSIKSDSEEAMLGLSKVYLETGDLESAEEWYDRFENQVGDVETSEMDASVRSDYEYLTSEFSERSFVESDENDDSDVSDIGFGYSDEDLQTEENRKNSSSTNENGGDGQNENTAADLSGTDDLVGNASEAESEEKDGSSRGGKDEETESVDSDSNKDSSKKSRKNSDSDSNSKEESTSKKEETTSKKEESTSKIDDERIDQVKDSYILPDSDQKYYSVEELSELSSEVLVYALCEIYARRGQIFDSEDLTKWFESFDWYHARTEKEEDVSKYFTDEEKENINQIGRAHV